MANCFANCVIRTPAVDAPRITDNMVEPDADIIAELMEPEGSAREPKLALKVPCMMV